MIKIEKIAIIGARVMKFAYAAMFLRLGTFRYHLWLSVSATSDSKKAE
jgi:hypothetical protein